MRRHPVLLVVLAATLALAGCHSPATSSADRSTAPLVTGQTTAPLPAPATSVSSETPPSAPGTHAGGLNPALPLPPYAGPPAGGPPSSGPPTTLQASVDLTSATGGTTSTVRTAVASHDGGAYVVLAPDDARLALRLATVRPVGGRFSVTGSAPIPLVDAWGMHVMTDGDVVVTGPLRTPAGAGSTFGFVVVDPRTGNERTTVAVAFPSPSQIAYGHSALAPDGRTLYLFVAAVTGTGPQQRLVAVDGVSGAVLRDRDLRDDVATAPVAVLRDRNVRDDVSTASGAPTGQDVAGLAARPRGGVTLVVDTVPDPADGKRVPTLLAYDALLTPAGGPRAARAFPERIRTVAVAGGIDGTVFLVVALTGSAWVLAVPDGGGAGPVLAQITDSSDVPALVVEPAQVWGLLSTPAGARTVDLTSGAVSAPLDLGCPAQDVRAIFPGRGGTGALVIGECNSARPGTETLWIVRS